ncbi:S-adenosyl-L-methionine-dependent methyltransferase [Radiomyces spectabilis]|uniref:S-adenosyl-L-methionine-dependent methyltransferase n=1 Tax=Radiomyces spectabilis TaxID=64574 RepID=UPI00221E95EE|nr:S-adenosyl-L-methionine-dependent methyltransferase [Radiomyces spectabilis]KAI8369226.1 S-adenosyl-L-methionine-dependent methyltransferase [Radiomyces spectabilis]
MSESTAKGLRHLVHTPFFTFFTGIVDSHHVASQHTSGPLRLLEVGCGSGEFAQLLKEHYQEKIIITAIDPHSHAVEKAKTARSQFGIRFENLSLLEADASERYDIILFTKSLHHCEPLEETVVRAYDLLDEHGIFVAEEMNLEAMNEATAGWYFGRLDLLKAADQLDKFNKHAIAAVTNASSLTPIERWKSMLMHSLPSADLIIKLIRDKFGSGNTRVTATAPFLHQFLVESGLKDTPVGKNVLTEFMAQEDQAIRDNIIAPVGIFIVAEKR